MEKYCLFTGVFLQSNNSQQGLFHSIYETEFPVRPGGRGELGLLCGILATPRDILADKTVGIWGVEAKDGAHILQCTDGPPKQ